MTVYDNNVGIHWTVEFVELLSIDGVYILVYHRLRHRRSYMSDNILAEKVREYRLSLGLTQEEFGAKLNYDHSTISKWETGKRNPDTERIKEVFGKEFGGDDRLKVQALRDIQSIDELEEAIEKIISEVEVDPAFAVTLRDMLTKYLYMMVGWDLRCNEHDRCDPLSWRSLEGSIQCFIKRNDFWPIPSKKEIPFEVVDGDKDLLIAKIEYLLDPIIGQEVFEDFDVTGIKYSAARIGYYEGYDLLDYLPLKETTMLTLFKASVRHLLDALDKTKDDGCEDDYPKAEE